MKPLDDDTLHDAICAPAREYVRDTPCDQRDPSVFTVARLQADKAVDRRKIESMKCCGNCRLRHRKGCTYYWRITGDDVEPCWEQTTERSTV